MTLHETFCENVRDLMSYHGMNQTDLANRLGVTQSFVSQLVSGKRKPGLGTIESVAHALGVDASRLLEKVPEKVA